MSLLTALYSGSSGIEANSEDLSIIGDNISNSGTIGFKESRADFEEQLSESLLGAGGIGMGTNMDMVQQILTQGSLTQTGNATDLALTGNGMFVVDGASNGVQGQFYTRDGEFTLNKDGYLVNQDGLRVQGYSADSSGGIVQQLGDLQVGNATELAQPTANISLVGDLSSNDPVTTFDATNPGGTASSSASQAVTIYDSLGNAISATAYFSKQADGSWDWNVMTDGKNLTGGVSGTATSIASGTLTFDTSGKLTAETQASTFNPIGAVQGQALNFNFGSPTGSGGSGVDGITQTASTKSAFTVASQDGFAAGSLSGVSVGSDGTITGTFTNGEQKALGQVAVANFAAPDRLQRLGGNLYQATPNDVTSGALGSASGGEGVDGFNTVSGSGDAAIGVAGTGGRGSITSGALEQSNVDITTQFVDMISAQRNFEASSKTVTTADTMLSDLMQMKR